MTEDEEGSTGTGSDGAGDGICRRRRGGKGRPLPKWMEMLPGNRSRGGKRPSWESDSFQQLLVGAHHHGQEEHRSFEAVKQ